VHEAGDRIPAAGVLVARGVQGRSARRGGSAAVHTHFWSPHDAHETAREAALLYARCRWQGITIRSPNDCLIAACAIEAGLPLLHADQDFGHIASIEPRLQLLP
jgi:predicted nucleic acid-binding protein